MEATIGKEDVKNYATPIDTTRFDITEFVNGTEDKICLECGKPFTGDWRSFLCYYCTITIYKFNEETK